ncbi:hypothetical protein OAT67_05375 [Bacteriovoracaceae bacterium]|nr:hypothetical protein [Bacteriovoracaceae bacterium]|tara:strand:+ start:136541 stop:137212 length:672 start_codon:yes stop_codon:yes gene_type:complete
MIELSFVNLPDAFTYLLRSNMQSSGKTYSGLRSYLNVNKGLKGIIEKSFKDIDRDCRFDRIINSLGWLGLRDRLAAIFLEHLHHGFFPHEVSLVQISPVLNFENKLKNSNIEGFSRAFMLGFYLSFVYHENVKDILDELVDDKVLEFLKNDCKKNQKLDVFLISLYYFRQFLGDDIFKLLRQGTSYQEIFFNLGENEQRIMTKNLLGYKASINEDDLFVDQTI